MKKGLIFIVLIFSALISTAANRTITIAPGYTQPNRFVLNASDTIVSGTTTTHYVTNLQKYMQNQVFTFALTAVTGTHNMAITAYGKVAYGGSLSGGTWVQIGTPITWVTASNNGAITSTSPLNYNYFKITFVESGSSCKALLTNLEIKTSNAYDIPANSGTLTISRATEGAVVIQTKDNDANAATNYRAGGTGALTLGSVSGTAAILSSDWAIDATGIATNMGTYNGLTILNSKARLVTTATAAADSTSAGAMLSAVDQFVTVTSGAASRSITLPPTSATTIGLVIEGWVGATGFDLRVATAQAMTVKLNDVTGAATVGVEAAIPATTKFRVVCVSATEWILTATTELGAVVTAIVPDPIEL